MQRASHQTTFPLIVKLLSDLEDEIERGGLNDRAESETGQIVLLDIG